MTDLHILLIIDLALAFLILTFTFYLVVPLVPLLLLLHQHMRFLDLLLPRCCLVIFCFLCLIFINFKNISLDFEGVVFLSQMYLIHFSLHFGKYLIIDLEFETRLYLTHNCCRGHQVKTLDCVQLWALLVVEAHLRYYFSYYSYVYILFHKVPLMKLLQ